MIILRFVILPIFIGFVTSMMIVAMTCWISPDSAGIIFCIISLVSGVSISLATYIFWQDKIKLISIYSFIFALIFGSIYIFDLNIDFDDTQNMLFAMSLGGIFPVSMTGSMIYLGYKNK